jgi:hypothetical protein
MKKPLVIAVFHFQQDGALPQAAKKTKKHFEVEAQINQIPDS